VTGELAGYACRFDFRAKDGTPDKLILPVTFCDLGDGSREWRAKGIPAPRPLYNLQEIAARPEAGKLVVEGEKTANAAASRFPDFVTTTSMHGTQSPAKSDWRPLAGQKVTIWPDNDVAGRQFAQAVARLAMEDGAASVTIVAVPNDWPVGWDLADPLPEGVTGEFLADLLRMATAWQPQPQEEVRAYLSFGSYRMTESGLWFGKDGGEKPVWLSSAFEVLAQTRDPRSSGWGLLLRWRDPDGRAHEWAMPKAALGGRREEIWRALLGEGLKIASAMPSRTALADYLTRANPPGRARGVERVGWHPIGARMAFVLPDDTIGQTGDERMLWQSEARSETFFNVAGTATEWKAEVAALCVGNTRLAFAVSVGFAAPLLEIAPEESGGFHFFGGSRTGKTTAIRGCGSVWGGGGTIGFARTWRATSNGLEGIAELHNDVVLCLDEMGQVAAREAGEIAYMLANGVGKGRAGRDGSARRSARWRLLILSTGELTLSDKLAEIGKMATAGQEVRLVDIPADAGAGHGLFEDLHGYASPGEFAEALRAATERQYGAPIREFLHLLTERYDVDPGGLRELIRANRDDFMRQHLPADASSQVRSVCSRFALVAGAGNLATALGLTGWPDDEADDAAAACFAAWLERRGTAGDGEIEKGIAQVIAFVEAHGSSRFEAAWDDADGARVNNRAGFRKQEDKLWQFYILPEVWKREVTKGFDSAKLARAMIKRGLMIEGKDRPAAQVYVPGYRNIRLYCLAPEIIAGEPGGVQ
jgi:uncharacterized protein (DUF927 family)